MTKLIWHSCGPFVKAMVKRSLVAENAKEMNEEREHVSPKELQADLRQKHVVEVKPRTAMKAVSKARRL